MIRTCRNRQLSGTHVAGMLHVKEKQLGWHPAAPSSRPEGPTPVASSRRVVTGLVCQFLSPVFLLLERTLLEAQNIEMNLKASPAVGCQWAFSPASHWAFILPMEMAALNPTPSPPTPTPRIFLPILLCSEFCTFSVFVSSSLETWEFSTLLALVIKFYTTCDQSALCVCVCVCVCVCLVS